MASNPAGDCGNGYRADHRHGGFAGGGEFNRKYGNKLMQMRVLLQFIAIILICGVLYLAK